MKKFLLSLFACLLFSVGLIAQNTFTFDDMIGLKRVGDPQVSPDGSVVAFTIGNVTKSTNRSLTQIYTVKPNGSDLKQITNGESSSSSPRWSPDGKSIAFTSGGQVWTMNTDGSNRKQITNISTGASNPVWSPDGKSIAFSSEVYPECKDDACNKAEDERVENSKVKAKVTERLLFKHWDEWRDRKRTHVFIVSSSGGTATDLTPGDFDSPPYSASTGVDYAFSPDSKEITFIRNFDRVEAKSTNSDIVVMSLDTKAQKNITESNKGYDTHPLYTRNGKYILYLSQKTPTFEADRWRIMRYDRKSGETVELTTGFDLQVSDLIQSADEKEIFFTAGERGRSPIFSVPLEPNFRLRIATHVKPILKGGYFSSVKLAEKGKKFILVKSSINEPAAIFSVTVGKQDLVKISPNDRTFSFPALEEVEWNGAENTKIHGFITKPIGFDPSKKYPLIVLIHGGPQSAWNDSWGYRWNPQMFANAGYVVFMPNPRGSTGYGQKFVDDISGDWGGKVYTDLTNGVAEVIKRPYIDANRIGGAGASYGGYMVNWILGHNDDPRFKFKTLVSHAGVYNLESMATATEEIFFVNWEFKGMPWENPEVYNKWSPHKFANKFNTPTLVTAGELDYRVPVDQSLQLYTTLQLKNVPSKLVVFPDEGHWILKPQNSEFWFAHVIGWFDKHLK